MRRNVRFMGGTAGKIAIALAAVVLADRACDDGTRRPSAVREPRPTSVTIIFERHDESLDVEHSNTLDVIAERAMTDLSARILVFGFANDGASLTDNLDLAERRARTVARYLMSRSVAESQIVVAAAETSSDNPIGARCDVDLVQARQGAPSARGLLPSPRDAQARSALSSVAAR